MSKSDIFLTIASLALIYLIALSSYHYGLKALEKMEISGVLLLLSHPQTKAMSKPTRAFSLETGSYLTKKERDEYKIYLMEQETETNYMYLDEWKLSKVFKKTLTQLERE